MEKNKNNKSPLHTYSAKAYETTLLDSSLINNSKRYIESTVKRYPDGTTQVKHFKSTIVVNSEHSSGGKSKQRAKEKEKIYDNLYRTKTAVYDIAKSNVWSHFLTLTINGEVLDRYNLEECSKKVRKWLNNVQQRIDKDLKYLMVFETHKDGAFHFHALINTNNSSNLFVDSGHKSKGKIVYNIPSFTYGFSTALECSNSKELASYITKYITKDMTSRLSLKGFHRYYNSRNCIKPDKQSLPFKFPVPEDSVKLWDSDISTGYEFHRETLYGSV